MAVKPARIALVTEANCGIGFEPVTRTLAGELRPSRIPVNAVCPGSGSASLGRWALDRQVIRLQRLRRMMGSDRYGRLWRSASRRWRGWDCLGSYDAE